jgi:hypothetical protein
MTEQRSVVEGQGRAAGEVMAELLRLQSEYDAHGNEAMDRRATLVKTELPEILRMHLARMPDANELRLDASDGLGNKARIPWVRIFSDRMAPSAMQGWYVVLLFAADGHAAYLSLNQGTTGPTVRQAGRRRAYLARRVSWAHDLLARADLDQQTEAIDLRDTGSLGTGYEQGDVLSRAYRREGMPDDREFADDLNVMVARLRAIYVAEGELARLPQGYGPGRPLDGFTEPASFVSGTVDDADDQPGVHVVWDPDRELIYAGSSGQTRTRLRQHLGGDRQASILREKVGRDLDVELGRDVTQDEINNYLSACTVAWRLTADSDAVKARIMDELRPRYNEVRPRVQEPAGRVLCVYVGEAGQRNLQVGLESRTWGFKNDHPDYASVRPGDWVVIAAGYSGGSPRVNLDEWKRHGIRRVILGRVTRAPYLDGTPLWPDERSGQASYPHRFGFEVVSNSTDVVMSDDDPTLASDVADAIRRSAINAGVGVVVDASGALFHEDDSPASLDLSQVCTHFADALTEANLNFGTRHQDFVRGFVVSLATKGLVLLTGLSGSGKTRIAIALGEWFGADQLAVLPVRPDWTGPDYLLGYEDALLPTGEGGRRAWTVPNALEFILRAAADRSRPYLLVLDEMNLAHVERYFADVLSGIESGEPVLPNVVRDADGYWRIPAVGPQRLRIPPNALVVGTVNVDETTYMFSPKVLDRANTIEFQVATADLRVDALPPTPVAPAPPNLVSSFLRVATDRGLHTREPASNRDQLADGLRKLHGLLARHNFEFGHRVFFEAMRFAALLELAGETGQWRALDLQVKQKVLPRMHGSVKRLALPLAAVGRFCYDLSIAEDGAADGFDFDAPGSESPALPDSFDKARRMMASLRANHFASYSE